VQWLIPIIATTQEVEIDESQFKASPDRKLARPHIFFKKLVHTQSSSYTESVSSIAIQVGLGKNKARPYLKNT
jgi:hypothetical protein